MSIFKIDAETTARRIFGFCCGCILFLFVIMTAIPFLIAALIIYLTNKIGFELRWFEEMVERVLKVIDNFLDPIEKWIRKVSVSEKAKVWKELTKKEENE